MLLGLQGYISMVNTSQQKPFPASFSVTRYHAAEFSDSAWGDWGDVQVEKKAKRGRGGRRFVSRV